MIAVALSLAALLAAGECGAVGLTARPVFGEDCVPRSEPGELIATVDNPSASALSGTLTLDLRNPNPTALRTVRAVGLTVPGRSRVSVRMVTPAPMTADDFTLRLIDANGRSVASATVAFQDGVDAVIVDATTGSRYAYAQRTVPFSALSAPIAPASAPEEGYFAPMAHRGLSADMLTRSTTCVVSRNRETGEAVLPRTAEGYRHVSMVLIDTSTLGAMPEAEATTLADWIITGGSVALVVDHPSDITHPNVTNLLGRNVEAFAPPTTRFSPGDPWRARPAPPRDGTLAMVTSYRGGNLSPITLARLVPGFEPYALGASADYGSGLVHALSWNPARPPALDDPWSSAALQTLTETSARRRDHLLMIAARETSPIPRAVRVFLGERAPGRPCLARSLVGVTAWGLAVALALALSGSRRRYALALVPLLSLPVTMALARHAESLRRDQGHARAISVIDLHGGMTRGAFRRYLSVESADALVASLRSGDERGGLFIDVGAGTGRVTLVTERDGVSLQGLALAPSRAVIVREEGFQTLPGAVSLSMRDGSLRVTNGLPWALEDVVVHDGRSPVVSFARLGAGASRGLASHGQKVPIGINAAWLPDEALAMIPWELRPAHSDESPSDALTLGAVLPRYFGHPERTSEWSAALAVPSVGDAPARWTLNDTPTLIARVVLPRAGDARVADQRVEADAVWLHVSGLGVAP